MKALKTIVATAVIVFALTTVAAAGVRHLGDRDGDAQRPAYAPTSAHPVGAVTLSAEQFAALLKAAGDDGSKHRAKHVTRTHRKAKTHSRTHATEADHNGIGAQHSEERQQGTGGASHQGSGGATHHAETTTVHDGGTQGDNTHNGGSHDAGSHDGGSHDGGCD
jgi:hypothetical protein